MDETIRFDEDWHVSSTFSDGTGSVEENVHAAEARHLNAVCLVDRVRRATSWVRDFLDACDAADRRSRIDVHTGLEVEVLDTEGTLELPVAAAAADHLFVAAHRLPTPSGPIRPEEAREQIQAGRLIPAKAVEWLTRAYANAARREGSVVLAHPFSVLAQIGIDARTVHPAYVRWLAGVMVKGGASAEINERWRCPSPGVIGPLLTAGVTVRASTGSTSPETVGRYGWCGQVVEELSGDRYIAMRTAA